MPLASRRSRGSVASATAQSPLSREPSRVTVAADADADPGGRHCWQTMPPDATEKERCGPSAPHRAATSSSLSTRRPTMPTWAPRRTSSTASAAPIPDDAPVTTTLLPDPSGRGE